MQKILIACEESQVVTIAFRKLGFEAFSCDLKPCTGGHPELHFQEDVSSLLKYVWNLIIAFPPCTHLSVSGARYWEEKQKDGRQRSAINFFMKFVDVKCKMVAIENPIGIISTVWRRPDQIIQPWQFGHGHTKSTCLWLKNLPLLKSTNVVDGRIQYLHNLSPSKERSTLRSKTYPGVAKAMASQWGAYLS